MRTLKINSSYTKRESNAFTRYLQEVAKIKKDNLTTEEEVSLAKRIQIGDKKAEEELIKRNLRFVISVAKQYQCDGCPLEDLVNEGNIGLIKASRKFDISRGFKFISYAVWLIRQMILCYISEHARTIRLPQNKTGQIVKIKKTKEKLEQILQRKPTIDEIIDELDMNIDINEINEALLVEMGAKSLSMTVSSDNSKNDGIPLEELLADFSNKSTEEQLEESDLKRIIVKMLNKMSQKERRVIELLYGLNGNQVRTLDEIGEMLDLTRERIRQIKKRAIKRMGESKENYIAAMSYIK